MWLRDTSTTGVSRRFHSAAYISTKEGGKYIIERVSKLNSLRTLGVLCVSCGDVLGP
jgi:hypothetical protein